jgi:hypothetical protein
MANPDSGSASPFAPVSEIMQAIPDGGVLRAVWGSGPDDVHLGGENGLLFDVAANDNISHVMLGTGKDIGGIWGSSQDDVWAVGIQRNTPRGFVLRKNGAGSQWIEAFPTNYGLHSIWGSGNQHFAVGYSGAIFSGADLMQAVAIDRAACAPATTFSPELWSVSGNSPSSVLVAGDVCSNYRYDGATWFTESDLVDPTRTFRAVWGVPGAAVDFFEGANYFGLWHFQGAGKPVTQLNEEKAEAQNLSRYIWSIWGWSSTQVVCVGDAGRIMTWDGTAVKMVPSPTTNSLFGVWGASPDDVWIVGDGGLVLRGKLTF